MLAAVHHTTERSTIPYDVLQASEAVELPVCHVTSFLQQQFGHKPTAKSEWHASCLSSRPSCAEAATSRITMAQVPLWFRILHQGRSRLADFMFVYGHTFAEPLQNAVKTVRFGFAKATP